MEEAASKDLEHEGEVVLEGRFQGHWGKKLRSLLLLRLGYVMLQWKTTSNFQQHNQGKASFLSI